MYNGNENLISDGRDLPYTMLNFWQWGYSNLLQNMQRGAFAEFLVHCALCEGGFNCSHARETTIQPYDLDGPIIPSTGKFSRLEVKSAAYVQTWKIQHPDRANFSIRPAMLPDEGGNFKESYAKQRNNDIYIFTVYTATEESCNILDMSWWEFYVLPTYKIDTDETLCKQKTITLKKVKELCPTLSFDKLYDAIVDACNSIPAEYEHYIIPPDKK